MNVNRLLHLHGKDPVKRFQDFLADLWVRVELDAILAPVGMPDQDTVSPQVVSQPLDIMRVNPFAPLMLSNSAALVQDFVRDNPDRHLAVILRPCELRALVELQKRRRVRFQPIAAEYPDRGLMVIGVDCPGTFPEEEYTQHADSHRNDVDMIRVEVTYGRQESYIPYEVRPTCQMCDSPGPLGADLVIGTIGTATQGELLVIARNEEIDACLKLHDITDGIATEHQVVYREMMVGKLADKRAEKRAALMNNQTMQIEDLGAILATFARCTLCADCLDACPLYAGELAGVLGIGEARQNGRSMLYELVRVSRWLASCSGCGMCKESCEQGVPIHQMITLLSHRIQTQLNYRPGDPSQPLPWTV